MELLGGDLRRRFNAPKWSVTFYAHLFLAVLLGGGAGIWYTLYESGFHSKSLAGPLLTYFPALVAAALIDFTHEKQPYLRSFGLISGGVFLIIFFFAALSEANWKLVWALGGTLLSVFFWWVANGEKECFRDVQPDASTGGDINTPLLKSTDSTWKK